MTDRMASGRMPRLAHSRPPQGSSRGADRATLLAKVHVARKQLALTEDSYRDILRRVIGLDSAGKASAEQLDQVLQEFKRLGFTAKRARPDHRAQIRKIEAVWADLRPFREALDQDEDRAALRAFVRRQTKDRLHPEGVDDVQFLAADQATKVLEGLKAWLGRERRKASAQVAA